MISYAVALYAVDACEGGEDAVDGVLICLVMRWMRARSKTHRSYEKVYNHTWTTPKNADYAVFVRTREPLRVGRTSM